jgi:hypothetical protein
MCVDSLAARKFMTISGMPCKLVYANFCLCICGLFLKDEKHPVFSSCIEFIPGADIGSTENPDMFYFRARLLAAVPPDVASLKVYYPLHHE